MYRIKDFFSFITKPRVGYTPLIEVTIFKDALLHNLHEYQKKYPKFLYAPVLKSNAYGHGLVQVGRILDGERIAFFMVDSFYEALTLRQHGVRSPILVLGFERVENLINPKLNNCTSTIIDFQTLQQVCAMLKKPVRFHLKIDTGMHRQGILFEEIKKAAQLIKQNSNFILEGVCSHFADADGTDETFTLKQISKWNEAVQFFKSEIPGVKYFHISNTAGNFFSENIQANVGRLGIGLYGINVSQFEKMHLEPALEMVSLISSIKKIPAGEKIGYGITFETIRPSVVATVPVGYTEGVDRRLSNVGFYKVGNVFCPLVGRVSMNMSSIDVSEIGNLQIGDKVVVISQKSDDKNSIESIAKLCGCIPYEVLVRIPQYLRRVVL